jgi:hypothetical protein
MGEGRKSLVGMLAVSALLTFFVETPISLDWGGVQIPERSVWVCLLIAHLYFCLMAYTKGVFSGVDTGTTSLRSYLADSGNRPKRIAQVLDTYGASAGAVAALILIIAGLWRSQFGAHVSAV